MDQSESQILDPHDLEFCLYDWLQVERLTDFDRYSEHSRETFDGMLDLSRQLAEELFLPHNRLADLNEPHLVDGKVRLVDGVSTALEAFAEAGFLSATMDESDGGFQLPHVVFRAAFMWFQAANVATVSYPMLTAAAAHLIREHATPELVERFLPPMLDGRWFGTMNLSEPGIGSALGDLKTSARRMPDGTYRLRGDKMWISGGDHELSENIVHLVLARTGGAGVKGLSLFIVPKWLGEPGLLTERNDVELVGLNHKMGYRGTVNTALSYGSGAHPAGGEAGAVGYLIGDEGQGLQYMFLMMNEARISVGASASALAMTSFLHARNYARSRLQGRNMLAKGAEAPPVAIIEHPDVRRMLLQAKAYAEGAMAVTLYSAKVLDESETASSEADRAGAEQLIEVLTPIVKSWPSQWGLAANDLAIQVLGGSGYTRDFPLEQFYRDNRLNPIHEGTHGIQGLDLLGRKVRLNDGSGFANLIARMRFTLGGLEHEPKLAEQFATRIDRLEQVTASLWVDNDAATALSNSSTYLEAAGDIVVAWLLLDQLVSLRDAQHPFADAKRLTTGYFVTHILPRVDPQLALLESKDRMLVELDDALI